MANNKVTLTSTHPINHKPQLKLQHKPQLKRVSQITNILLPHYVCKWLTLQSYNNDHKFRTEYWEGYIPISSISLEQQQPKPYANLNNNINVFERIWSRLHEKGFPTQNLCINACCPLLFQLTYTTRVEMKGKIGWVLISHNWITCNVLQGYGLKLVLVQFIYKYE